MTAYTIKARAIRRADGELVGDPEGWQESIETTDRTSPFFGLDGPDAVKDVYEARWRRGNALYAVKVLEVLHPDPPDADHWTSKVYP